MLPKPLAGRCLACRASIWPLPCSPGFQEPKCGLQKQEIIRHTSSASQGGHGHARWAVQHNGFGRCRDACVDRSIAKASARTHDNRTNNVGIVDCSTVLAMAVGLVIRVCLDEAAENLSKGTLEQVGFACLEGMASAFWSRLL